MEITYQQMKDLLRENRDMSGGSGFNIESDKVSSGLFGKVKEVLKGAEGLFDKLSSTIAPQINLWQTLEKSGTKFGGGLTELYTTSLIAHTNVQQFAETINRTGINIKGFGATSNDATKNFGNFVGAFYESGLTDGLRNLGLSFNDINDSLALYATISGPINMNDANAKKLAVESAAKLTKEMDMQSRLMGISREEQMEAAKAAKLDAQFNAKLREMTLNMTPEEGAKVQAEFRAKLGDYVNQGIGESFKEMVVYGTAGVGDAAKAQVSILGDGIQGMQGEIEALRAGRIKDADDLHRANSDLVTATLNTKDVLQIISMAPLTSIGTNLDKAFLSKQTESDKLSLIAAEMHLTSKRGEAEVEQKLVDELRRRELLERDKKVTGTGQETTTALLEIEARAKDAIAAGAKGLSLGFDDLNKHLRPLVESTGLLGNKSLTGKNELKTVQEIENQNVVKGYQFGNTPAEIKKYAEEAHTTMESISFNAGKLIKNLVDITGDVLERTADKTGNTPVAPKKPQYEFGMPTFDNFIKSGNIKDLIPTNFGAGTTVDLHGDEFVATKKQMEQAIQKAQGSFGNALTSFGTTGGSGHTLDDFFTVLKQISTAMSQMVTHTSTVAGNTSTQIRVTKSLSNNMYEAG